MDNDRKERSMLNIADKFTELPNPGEKLLALNVMTAYISGIYDERARWQNKEQAEQHKDNQ